MSDRGILGTGYRDGKQNGAGEQQDERDYSHVESIDRALMRFSACWTSALHAKAPARLLLVRCL